MASEVCDFLVFSTLLKLRSAEDECRAVTQQLQEEKQQFEKEFTRLQNQVCRIQKEVRTGAGTPAGVNGVSVRLNASGRNFSRKA